MAERTLRRNKQRNTGAVIAASDDAGAIDGNLESSDEPVTIESDGTVVAATIDDYVLDESDNQSSGTFVDPATGSGSSADTGTRRRTRSDAGTRRGRRKSRADATETTRSIANMLYSAHLAIGTLVHSEVFPITKEEAEELGKAVTNVSQLYDLPVIGEKALAWTNLAMVMGTIYGPRIVAVKMNKKKKPAPVVVEMRVDQQSGT